MIYSYTAHICLIRIVFHLFLRQLFSFQNVAQIKMHKYAHTCIQLKVYPRAHTCIHTNIHTYSMQCICTHPALMLTYNIRTHMQTNVPTGTHTHIHTIHRYIYTQLYTYIHIHLYTPFYPLGRILFFFKLLESVTISDR